jgi:transposase
MLEFFAKLPRCRIGLAACGGQRFAPTCGGRRWEPGAHHWPHALTRLGHDARLTPPQDVKASIKSNQHAAADAEARAQRPRMRFVPVKSATRQATRMLHRVPTS